MVARRGELLLGEESGCYEREVVARRGEWLTHKRGKVIFLSSVLVVMECTGHCAVPIHLPCAGNNVISWRRVSWRGYMYWIPLK